MEELTTQAVGALNRGAGLRPHQGIELAFRHDWLRAGSIPYRPVSAAANMGSGSRVGRSGGRSVVSARLSRAW